MQFKGEVTIPAPRKMIRDFMIDAIQTGQCAPGVEKIETIEEMKCYRGVISVGLGSVKARFNAEVKILELDEPNRAKPKAHGTATGSAADALSETMLRDGPHDAAIVNSNSNVNSRPKTG